MRINVAQLLMAPVGSIRDVHVDDSRFPAPGSEFESITGSLQLMRTNNGIWARGNLYSLFHATCSRCLKEFVRKAHFCMDESFSQAVDVRTGMRLKAYDESDSFTIDAAHNLDISEAIRQHTIMNLPMKPLCNEDCAGLCSICGVARAHQTCSCETSYRDLPWARLINLPEPK